MKKYFFGLVWFMMINFGCVVLAAGLSSEAETTRKPNAEAPLIGKQSAKKIDPKKAFGNKIVYKYGGFIIILSAILAVAGTMTGSLPGTAERRTPPE